MDSTAPPDSDPVDLLDDCDSEHFRRVMDAAPDPRIPQIMTALYLIRSLLEGMPQPFEVTFPNDFAATVCFAAIEIHPVLLLGAPANPPAVGALVAPCAAATPSVTIET